MSRGEKVPLEDFAQLIGASRDTKYDVSTERCAEVLFDYCTYPTIEARRLFQRLVFSFLIGNEDLHIKNLSLITKGDKTTLSPAYDLLNSSIVMPASKEEMALSLNGKKKGLTRKDFVEDFAAKSAFLNFKVATKVVDELVNKLRNQDHWIEHSFLNDEEKKKYSHLLRERLDRLS